jgi:urea transport system permease protein
MPFRTPIRAGLLALALALPALFGAAPASADVGPDDEVRASLAQFRDADFDGKTELIEKLVTLNHPRVAAILKALSDSRLYYLEEGDRVVIGLNDAAEVAIEDAVSGEALGQTSKRGLDRITANNRLRSLIENRLAGLGLASADPPQRKAAVEAFLRNPDPAGAAPLRARLAVETDGGIKELLGLALALADLASDDATVRAKAATALGGQMQTEIRGPLAKMAAEDGDPAAREAARIALARTEFRLQMLGWAETLFFGLSLGSVLILAAIGLAVTFGVMGVINMAHGELMMLGAYTTWWCSNGCRSTGRLPVAVPLAFLVAALVGIAIERGIIRFLYGRPLETLLATFGVSLILQQAVRSIFSPAQPLGRHPGLDERHDACWDRWRSRSTGWSSSASASRCLPCCGWRCNAPGWAWRCAPSRRTGDGAGDGRALGAGGCADLRPGQRHRRGRRRGPVAS